MAQPATHGATPVCCGGEVQFATRVPMLDDQETPVAMIYLDRKKPVFVLEEYGPDLARPGGAVSSPGQRREIDVDTMRNSGWLITRNSLMTFGERGGRPSDGRPRTTIEEWREFQRRHRAVHLALTQEGKLEVTPMRLERGQLIPESKVLVEPPLDQAKFLAAVSRALGFTG